MIIASSDTTITKSRNSGSAHDGVVGWSHSSLTPSIGIPTFVDEVISYERGKNVFFKNCYHRKHELSTNMPTKDTTRFPGNENGDHVHITINPCAHITHAIYGHGSFPTAGSPSSVAFATDDIIEDLAVSALKNMVPRSEDISNGFNIGNFIAELRDIKQMFVLWKANTTFWKNVSSGVLNWELAWKPFLGDIETILTRLGNMQSYIDRWNQDAKNGTIYTRHANMTDEYVKATSRNNTKSGSWIHHSSDGPHAPWTPDTHDDMHHHHRYNSTNEEAACFFHLYYKPKHIHYNDIIDKISIWGDALGLGDGFSIVWEAVPFSFVADWFYGIGDFLEQFEIDAFEVPYEIVDFGFSEKISVEKEYGYRSDSSESQGRIHGDVGRYTYKDSLFKRRRIHPPIARLGEWSFDPLLSFKCPTWRQMWVGLNLANVLRK